MKRSSDSSHTTDTMPSFLDDMQTQVDADPSQSIYDEADDAGLTEAGGDEEGHVADSLEEPAEGAIDDDVDPSPHRGSVASNGRAARGSEGSLAIVFGAVLLFGSIVLAFLPGVDQSNSGLSRFGLEPRTLTVLGALFLVAGMLRRAIATMHGHGAALPSHGNGNGNEALLESLQERLQFLIDAQQANHDRPAAGGDDVQHALVALQRQDEKINNLTKAIKMYGKPLMEISGQGAELAGGLGLVKTSVDAGGEAVKQAFARLEAMLRGSGNAKELAELKEALARLETQLRAPGNAKENAKEFAELKEAMGKVAAAVQAANARAGAAPSLEPLQQQVSRLEVSVAALGQRLEDKEVRKSLLRLEDATQKAREEVQSLSRSDNLHKTAAQLQDRFDKATSRLSDGIQQLRDGNLGGLESAVREIQRDIAGVATSVAQIQATVKASGRLAASAAAAGSPAAPAPAAAAAPNRTEAPAGKPAAADSGSGYQTGTRSSNAKNVLGAIAKLKQMKN